MHKTTLEQWFLLDSVVNEGSFALAAEKNNRSQSSVSYQIGLLQQRLGVALLQQAGRRAVLTAEGQQLLAQARPLLTGFSSLEAQAAALQRGEPSRVDLMVDAIAPKPLLFKVLHQFQQRYPHVRVWFSEIVRSETPLRLAEQQADLWLVAHSDDQPLAGESLMSVDFIAVAHRDHPLHSEPAPLSATTLARWPCITILDRQQQQQSEVSGEQAENWSFTTLSAAIEAVQHQLGYGWLPEKNIAALLESGELRPLPLLQGRRRSTSLMLRINEERLPGNATIAVLAQMFIDQVAVDRRV
ncbi:MULTISPECIES: LysR family transcriptional regulator [Pantoea]|jgi:DNA-binding transcriptional LysR family regulator|uniref:LysR family transcriptional regulator n=1 Tax=Pantoea brenneri TaxID=472694 RepID=A0A7Y6TRI4_9GAMM|nr:MULTISPECIES: LysR family transcriptional regulator [Pantoea]MBZ6394378.1 LysR family transcriptional regulator [Pantoea sp.]MBZ6437771.1 LysR family transcriptional regulator [Pantoea sp.]NUY41338.1 LysR family transcriptional regulator [Pantoea brenneri]NUY48838.1 LysR family transcriptional regulator [Pantoea brenneri]NUY59368.1 LysR family transcriptional regulator [Pantoea brenneri]